MGDVISINRKLERQMRRLLEYPTPEQKAAILEWHRDLENSSAVERLAVNEDVAGSIPASPANFIPENRIDLFCACLIAGLGAFSIAYWVL